MAKDEKKSKDWVMIRGQRLHEARCGVRGAGQTREQLADTVSTLGHPISVQTIKRIEKRGSGTYRVAGVIGSALAKALSVSVGVLTGDEDMPGEKSRKQVFPDVSLPMPRPVHNAILLVSAAYGVSPATVIGNAALLFALHAEQNLAERRLALNEMRDAVQRVRSLSESLGHLSEFVVKQVDGDDSVEAAEVLEAEEHSIRNRDILGGKTEGFWHIEYLKNGPRSPFTDYLETKAREAGLEVAEVGSYPADVRIPVRGEAKSDVISEALAWLAGDDEELQEAIAEADFVIPWRGWRTLRDAAPAERAKTLRRLMEADDYGAQQRKIRAEIEAPLEDLGPVAKEP